MIKIPTDIECPTKTKFHECKLPKETFGNRELFILMTQQILTPTEAIEIGKNTIFLNSIKKQTKETDWNIGFTFIENNYNILT